MNELSSIDKADKISRSLELAILLEVSGYPKPGNVHRTANFVKTTFEQYLASAVAIAPWFRKAGELGIKVSEGNISPSDIGIGHIIKNAADSMLRSQNGGNTLLGAIIILVPIAAARGMIRNDFSLNKLRKNIKIIVESSTTKDAIETYDAISHVNPGGLNKSRKLDVKNPQSKKKILDEGITLFETFEALSSEE